VTTPDAPNTGGNKATNSLSSQDLRPPKRDKRSSATFWLVSEPPDLGTELPRFIGADLVKGVLEVILEDPVSVHRLMINVSLSLFFFLKKRFIQY
jgi:hypothetical protein